MWKGTKREKTTTTQKLVMRLPNGQFAKNKPIIEDIATKNYGSGVYRIGRINGKIVIRQKISERSPYWFEQRKEVIANRKMFRTAYVLNDVPISVSSQYYKHATRTSQKSWSIGFRIVAFSHNQQYLKEMRQKIKLRLISFIEKCLKYSEEEFWFTSYYGYTSPELCNGTTKSDNNKYYCTLESLKGYVVLKEEGDLREL